MKPILLYSILFFWITACQKKEETKIRTHESKKVAFGIKYAAFDVVEDTIKKGDTFGNLIQNQNLGSKQVYALVNQIKKNFDVTSIQLNKPYALFRSKDKSKTLQLFVYQPDPLNYYLIDLRKPMAIVYKKQRPITYKHRVIGGLLKSSLSETLDEAGVEGSFATRISKIYAWSIDFFKVKKGDRFALSFTERYINDSIYDGVDSLQASFFEYKGKIIYAFPYAQKENPQKIEYYDEEGKTLKNFFLKTPIKFSRITSRFSSNRLHPVQQSWKAHKGTDYAAPTGTPITATAAGTIEQTGYTSGNGNFVKIKHNKTYSTQYLHMSRILVRQKQQVVQGQTIGLVGSTGLATGPHVCYRFWKNGIQVDALKLKLPNGNPMDNSTKQQFQKQIAPLKKELDSVANL